MTYPFSAIAGFTADPSGASAVFVSSQQDEFGKVDWRDFAVGLVA